MLERTAFCLLDLGYNLKNLFSKTKLSLTLLSRRWTIANFTITERILARWLVESFGLWEYRPWKWRNMSRSAGCFVVWFFVKKKSYCKKTKSTTISMVYTLIDRRNDAIKCSKLCSDTTRLRLVVRLEFWTFCDVTSMVYKSVDHGKLWSIC